MLAAMSTALTRRQRPNRGDELELTIDSLAFGGNGVARHDGYVVFVVAAIPGDRVRARITRPKRDYAEAITVEILEPSPERIPRHGAAPGRAVAGAAVRAPARDQAQQVEDALRRIGKLDGFAMEPIVPAVETVALPQQDGIFVRQRRERRSRLRLPRARPLGTDSPDRGLPDRLRALERREPPGARRGAGREGSPPRTAGRTRASCATSSCARAAARGRSRCGS